MDNVQDGSFSNLGELDPTLSWSAGTMSGDVEIEYGIEASARPNSVVDANNDGNDLDIHLEASAGDGFAFKTVSVVKGIDADGARVTFEPRYNYGNRTTTIVTDGKQGGEFVALISQIHREAEAADTDFDKEKVSMKDDDERIGAGILMKTLSNLSMQVATIASIVPSVSANETELKDKKLRYEDALNSVDSARELGIVPGGGATLAHLQVSMHDKVMAAMKDDDERIGAGILMKALSAPCMQVATNAGIEGAVVLAKVQAISLEKGVSTN